MKYTRLSLLFFTCVLLSCKKESSPAPAPLPANLNINTGYDPYFTDVNKYELIISENGKVLLDTITGRNNKIIAGLTTISSFLDVTVIHADTPTGQYFINSFIHVDPSRWAMILNNISYYSPITVPQGTKATLHYINAPSDAPHFVNTPMPVTHSEILGSGTLDVSYDRYPGYYTYLLFPSTGLYHFYIPSGDQDTVDLTHLDSAVKINFNLPAQVRQRLTFLNGFMDTTDFTKYLDLYSNLELTSAPYDLEYPKTAVQKFEFAGIFGNGNYESSGYYSFCDTVPTQLPYLDASSCSFGSTKNDEFTVQFNNIQPTYYRTDWVAGKITFKLFSAPDATTQHPLSFLNQQKSILLKNQDLSGLKLQNFNYEVVAGFDYAGYFNYVFNPELLNKKRVRSSVSFGRAFP
jgi:hypothetical protein